MVKAACPEDIFIEMFQHVGAAGISQTFDVTLSKVYQRRRRIERSRGIVIKAPSDQREIAVVDYPQRQYLDVPAGTVIAFSDAHYWPGAASTGHRALVKACREFGKELKAIIANGDILDGSTISRHTPIGWEKRPSLIQEIEASQERLQEIVDAAPRATRIWNLGNHDARFETRLATVAPEYARVNGVHLRDHFPLWEPAWSTWINDDLVIKHRFKSGIHAPHNNPMWAGKSIATGHLHSAKVYPLTDYNGTRFGVDLGCIADPDGPQFVDYTEDNPKSWRQAFGVFTFWNGRLLWPSLVHVIGPGQVEFERKVWEV